jgi:predicted Fe-S protein YdhL (DUF1289 family)
MMEDSHDDSQDRSERPLSPCILICTLDDNNECLGCGRNLEQISRWALMSKDEQWAVVDQLAGRGVDV